MPNITPEDVAKLAAAATPGPWGTGGMRNHDWSVDTDGENTVQFIGPKKKLPVCAVIVNAAFGKDHTLDANAAFIAAVHDMAALIAEQEAKLRAADEFIEAQAADHASNNVRYAEMSAKLAKAVEALDKIKRINNVVGVFAACERTIAELTGEKS